jgi:hypothetical protein
MREPLPLATIHDVALDFPRGRGRSDSRGLGKEIVELKIEPRDEESEFDY